MTRRPCKRCGKNRAERFFSSARSHICNDCKKRRARNYSRDTHLQENYEITVEEHDEIVEAQGGVCAICKGKRARYDTDHSHKLQKAGVPIRETVRGALCRRCNRRLLPACLDDIEILFNAIEYLLDPPAQRVLSSL